MTTEPLMYTTGKPRHRAARFVEREKRMRQLYDAGLNDREIGEELHCSAREAEGGVTRPVCRLSSSVSGRPKEPPINNKAAPNAATLGAARSGV